MSAPPPRVGKLVFLVDPKRKGHDALVKRILPRASGGEPHLNVIMVSDDPGLKDHYGPQTVNKADVPHEDDRAVGGWYWMRVWPYEPEHMISK